MYRTITAKYAGICRRCNGPIAIGQKIRYGGYKLTYHLKADCGQTALPADDDQETAPEVPTWSPTYHPTMDAPPADDDRDNGAPVYDDRDTADREPDPEPTWRPTPPPPAEQPAPAAADDWNF